MTLALAETSTTTTRPTTLATTTPKKEQEKKKRTTNTHTVYAPAPASYQHATVPVVAIVAAQPVPAATTHHQQYYPVPPHYIRGVLHHPISDHQRFASATTSHNHIPVHYGTSGTINHNHIPVHYGAPVHTIQPQVQYVRHHQPQQEYIQVIPVYVNSPTVPQQTYQASHKPPESYVSAPYVFSTAPADYNTLSNPPINPMIYYTNYPPIGNIGKPFTVPSGPNFLVENAPPPAAQPPVAYDVSMKQIIPTVPQNQVIAPYSLFVRLKNAGFKYASNNIPLADTTTKVATSPFIHTNIPGVAYPSPFQLQTVTKDHELASVGPYQNPQRYTTAVYSKTTPQPPKTYSRDSAPSNTYRKGPGYNSPGPSAVPPQAAPPLKNIAIEQQGNSVDGKRNYNFER